MPTPTKGPRLGGGPAHEKLLIANLARALFSEGRIRTTEAKAKRLRPQAERLITFAKRGDVASRRQVLTVVRDKAVVHKLFAEIAPRFAERQGGYTRILKLGPRPGDAAPMVLIELVEQGEGERARRHRGRRPAPPALRSPVPGRGRPRGRQPGRAPRRPAPPRPRPRRGRGGPGRRGPRRRHRRARRGAPGRPHRRRDRSRRHRRRRRGRGRGRRGRGRRRPRPRSPASPRPASTTPKTRPPRPTTRPPSRRRARRHRGRGRRVRGRAAQADDARRPPRRGPGPQVASCWPASSPPIPAGAESPGREGSRGGRGASGSFHSPPVRGPRRPRVLVHGRRGSCGGCGWSSPMTGGRSRGLPGSGNGGPCRGSWRPRWRGWPSGRCRRSGRGGPTPGCMPGGRWSMPTCRRGSTPNGCGGPSTGGLGPAITVREAAWAPAGFDARLSARRRTYVYRVDDSGDPDPLLRGFVLAWPRPLDLPRMREAGRPAPRASTTSPPSAASRPGATTTRRLRSLGDPPGPWPGRGPPGRRRLLLADGPRHRRPPAAGRRRPPRPGSHGRRAGRGRPLPRRQHRPPARPGPRGRRLPAGAWARAARRRPPAS